MNEILHEDLLNYFTYKRSELHNRLFNTGQDTYTPYIDSLTNIFKNLINKKIVDCLLLPEEPLYDQFKYAKGSIMVNGFIHQAYFNEALTAPDFVSDIMQNDPRIKMHMKRISSCYDEVSRCKKAVDTTGVEDVVIYADIRHLEYLRLVLKRFNANIRCAEYKNNMNGVEYFLEGVKQ